MSELDGTIVSFDAAEVCSLILAGRHGPLEVRLSDGGARRMFPGGTDDLEAVVPLVLAGTRSVFPSWLNLTSWSAAGDLGRFFSKVYVVDDERRHDFGIDVVPPLLSVRNLYQAAFPSQDDLTSDHARPR